MRRRQKKTTKLHEQYTPEQEQEPIAQEAYQTNQKKPKYKQVHGRRQKTKTQSRQVDESSNQEESQQSEILQFRHGDESAKQHVRPSFLRRWDGISNELSLTKEEMAELSPMMRQYWQVKSKNMNAIVFLEFGRMEFFAFENDAIKLNELYKKKLKRFSKFLMVNFWCKEIEQVKKELFAMKIPILVMNQIEDKQYRQEFGIIRRAVVEVATPALHINQEDTTPRSRLLLSVFHSELRCAVLVLDAESNHFFVEEFDDDTHYHQIRRIFNKYHPVELIIPNREHRQILQIARQICNPYINQFDIGLFDAEEQIKMFRQYNSSYLFKELHQLYEQQNYGIKSREHKNFQKIRIVNVLTLAWKYLASLSLLEKVFSQGIFHDLDHKFVSSVPFFDSQVYQNLEIFRIKSSQQETYAQPGTLMGYLNHCRTNHGRKLLHRWMDQPLTQQQAILKREGAVQELLQNEQLLDMHNQLMKFDKLEKRLGDIYHWVSRNYEKGKNILTKYINHQKQYDIRKNPAVTKLKEIIQILKRIQQYQIFLKKLRQSNIKSQLLKEYVNLVQIQNVHDFNMQEINKIQGIPEISYVADIILRRISYDQITGNLEPMPGENQVFDQQKKQMVRINASLEQQLNKWKQYFQTERISFVSVRAKNQIQVPKTAINKAQKTKDLIFSSEVANAIRYTTHDTNVLSEQLMYHEKAIAQSYEPFFQEIVDHFCRYKFLWNLYITSMSNVDVLMSLAQAAKGMPVRCMPKFIHSGMNIQNGFHVNLLPIKQDIVSNSVELQQNQKVLLLTGPNMGGKSTFLKQVCSFAILAQIGSFIPASRYQSLIYDQIFCRMGASDRIYEGKSTFYVELQQTKRILSKATQKSLVVIDELGRGTSTFDGMAIAEAILDHLLQKLKCMTLYSTHYTQITEKFQKNQYVKMMKMGYSIDSEGKFCFTYQLVNGVAEKSFATNVGRMVGIPQSVLQRAEQRSQKMHEQIKRKKQLRQLWNLKKSIKLSNSTTRTNSTRSSIHVE